MGQYPHLYGALMIFVGIYPILFLWGNAFGIVLIEPILYR